MRWATIGLVSTNLGFAHEEPSEARSSPPSGRYKRRERVTRRLLILVDDHPAASRSKLEARSSSVGSACSSPDRPDPDGQQRHRRDCQRPYSPQLADP